MLRTDVLPRLALIALMLRTDVMKVMSRLSCRCCCGLVQTSSQLSLHDSRTCEHCRTISGGAIVNIPMISTNQSLHKHTSSPMRQIHLMFTQRRQQSRLSQTTLLAYSMTGLSLDYAAVHVTRASSYCDLADSHRSSAC